MPETRKLPQNEHLGSLNDLSLSDIAIIELETGVNLEEKYGSLGYDFDWLPPNRELIALNKTLGNFITHLQGTLIMEGGELRHRARADNLISGSPILQVVDGEYLVRGIHINCNQAVFIDISMFEIIQKWFT